jgi:hypothetical protein
MESFLQVLFAPDAGFRGVREDIACSNGLRWFHGQLGTSGACFTKGHTRPAAFVDNPKPLLNDASGLPTLAEYWEFEDATRSGSRTIDAAIDRSEVCCWLSFGP